MNQSLVTAVADARWSWRGHFFQPNFRVTIRWVKSTCLITFGCQIKDLKTWQILGRTPYCQSVEDNRGRGSGPFFLLSFLFWWEADEIYLFWHARKLPQLDRPAPNSRQFLTPWKLPPPWSQICCRFSAALIEAFVNQWLSVHVLFSCTCTDGR